MMAEDVDDVLAGRTPRHRAGWREPELGEGTIVAGAALRPPAPPTRARGRRRRWHVRLTLVVLLALATAVYFDNRPGDARFWRRIVNAVKSAAVVTEAETFGVRSSAPPGALPTHGSPADAAGGSASTPRAAEPPAPEPAAEPTTEPARANAPEPAAPAADEPAPEPSPLAAAAVPAPVRAAEPSPSPAADPAPLPAGSRGQLAIDFEHHLRDGKLQVWVDGGSVFDADFDAQETRRILAFTVRRGLVQEVVPLPPGPHEVTVRVQWEDNVRTARIAGTFDAGATRRLDVSVARLGGKLSLRWK
jgi:hypothetical protein